MTSRIEHLLAAVVPGTSFFQSIMFILKVCLQFEKDEEDIFGLGQLLQSAKESGKEVKKRSSDINSEGSSSKKRR